MSPTHIVSTLPLPILHQLLPPNQRVPHLTANLASSVTVLNLVFDQPSNTIHPPGFGYLVPRSVNGYTGKDDSETILGAVFDSCALDGQDILSGQLVTKMTVMLGGPYRSAASSLTSSHKPQSTRITSFSLDAILSKVSTQLGHSRSLPPPVYWRVWDHQECIPLLRVGHLDRMREMRKSAQKDESWWQGRLEIVGAGVGGVSIGDCVQAGREVGSKWRQ